MKAAVDSLAKYAVCKIFFPSFCSKCWSSDTDCDASWSIHYMHIVDDFIVSGKKLVLTIRSEHLLANDDIGWKICQSDQTTKYPNEAPK